MPIRPIDMQTMLPRMQKQHNAKEVVVHKEQNAQHNNQLREQDHVQKKLKQVQKNEQKDKDSGRVTKKRRDEDSKNSKKKKKKKKKLVMKDDQEQTEEKQNEKQYLRRSHFDMKI